MKQFLLGCVAVMALGAAASAADAKTYRIGVAMYGLKGEFAQSWVNEAKKHPAIKDGTATLTVFDGNYDQLTQDRQFDEMIAQHYDAIIFDPIDSNAGGALVARAEKAGIPVIGSNGPVKAANEAAYIGSDDVKAGEDEAKAVIDKMGGKGNVVILQGPVGQLGSIQRYEGNQKALAAAPGIHLLEKNTANWSRAEALNLMQNWLTAHPGQINGVIGENDEMALGAIAAMRSQGIDPATVPTAGIDGVHDAMVAVSKGYMVLSIKQDAFTQAQGAVDLALRHIIGDSYKPLSTCWTMYPSMKWDNGEGKLYNVPWTYVTKANVQQFLNK
ncbi:substrate-binding domain-containing protein [Acetobacteraceae bacterium KSS8]|uniref:Substrate-binding domain-containing protein n=1 Tax=Endosaccharibacter trunci TaxID=2812733 RepID=A0ABT1W9Q1_9PROT|nr:substrate-binding domain-containing protein [Acetobacteraceae bacterium KSS8]